MLLMVYPSTREEDLPDYAKNNLWKLLREYIDSHIQILIDECTGDGVKSISIFKFQCENMAFYHQRIYNRPFQQVVHKGGESAINYIKIFQNDRAL